MSNPFFYGNPIPSDQFIGRKRELRRIVGRIANQGQSTAIVGEPRIGKTSLLDYLAAPEKRTELYDQGAERLLFSYLDAQTLGGKFAQAKFWKRALSPLYEQVVAPNRNSPLALVYRTCKQNAFGAFVMERLLAQMRIDEWRLVLLLDEFDVLLHHPILNSAEFFGSLRSLASRSRGALAMVIASRQSLTILNKDTQDLSRTGSPYFNFLDEITLGAWTDKDVKELLRQAGNRFNPADRGFLINVAGGHPYLLQAAASELWEAYAEDYENRRQCREQVGQNLYDKAAPILDDTWRLWSPATRKAFTIVALTDVAKMMKERQFFHLPLARDQRDLGPELRSLKKRGFVTEDKTVSNGWRVRPQVFLWWLADEMVRTVRDKASFDEWLGRQEFGVLLTRGEREWLDGAIGAVGGVLEQGAIAFIGSLGTGLGEGVGRTITGGA